MTDLRRHLERGDPAAHDAGMSSADVDRIRRRLATEAAEPTSRPFGLFLAFASGVLAIVISVTWFAYQPAAVSLQPETVNRPSSGGSLSVRQLQFTGPSGTRLIWTFNPNFEVR